MGTAAKRVWNVVSHHFTGTAKPRSQKQDLGYESVNECMEGVCKMYEEHMKRNNPNSPSTIYSISQLFDIIDDLANLSCLAHQANTQTHKPYNKDGIKENIYVLLHRQAQQASK